MYALSQALRAMRKNWIASIFHPDHDDALPDDFGRV